ncbi:MAG: glucosaminidase domain-containing protein [Bacteroidota bacterium]
MNTRQLQQWEMAKKHLISIKGLFLLIAILFFSLKDVSIEVGMENAENESIASYKETPVVEQITTLAKNVSNHSSSKVHIPTSYESKPKSSSKISSSLANTYSNLTYSNPKLGKKENSSARAAKRKKQKDYVDRFSKVAIKEMKQYGIPASITLAQGLIESNCGESRLAKRNNNHFGIKCFSRTCKKGHCSNFTDDTHKDFFRIYKSSWDSYRAHSQLLQKARYKKLYKIPKSNYKGWARGLKSAGYATDPLYADKLINLIEDLDLTKYDK